MKIIRLFLFYSCLFWTLSLQGQQNVISNPQFNTPCNDIGGNCKYMDFTSCVPGWIVTHGSPNYVHSTCPGDDEPSNRDYHVQMICKQYKSEGIMTPINLFPGAYKLYLRARVTDIPSGYNLNLRVSLDQDLVPIPESQLTCQQTIPETDVTTVIYDEALNEDGEWHWIVVEVNVSSSLANHNQLMITGLVDRGADDDHATFHVDCIYLYQVCHDPIIFPPSPANTYVIEDGSYLSCSYIESENQPNGIVEIPVDAEVDLLAPAYILLKPNFHGKYNFCARIIEQPERLEEGFRPPCDGCNLGGNLQGEASSRTQEATLSEALEVPVISPNPASTRVKVQLPDGLWNIAIYNMLGHKIYQGLSQQSVSIVTENWPEGWYIINMKHDKQHISTTLLIQ